jgi:hypothetical protein
MALIDVLVFNFNEDPTDALKGVPGFYSDKGHVVASADKTRYSWVHWFKRIDSKMKFCLESDPLDRWLPPYRLQMYADDQVGLVADEVMSILEVIPGATLILVELAVDFSPLTGVNAKYVRERGVFGRSQRDLSKNPYGDWWGARKACKRTKSYFKQPVGGHRVELRIRSAFLHEHDIYSIFDFHRFAELIPRQHIFFGRLDEDRLIGWLRRERYTGAEIIGILREVVKREGCLTDVLKYLSVEVGLKNTRRLLLPLRPNKFVRDALRELVRKWPAAPTQLGGGQPERPTADSNGDDHAPAE